MPLRFALSQAKAPGLSLMTMAISAGTSPSFIAWAIASRLVPEPDARMPSRILDSPIAIPSPFERQAPGRPAPPTALVVLYGTAAGPYLSHLERPVEAHVEHLQRLAHLAGRHHQQHSEPHVERLQHLEQVDASDLLNEREDVLDRPGPVDHLGVHVARQHAWQVLGDAAAGDVGYRPDVAGFYHLEDRRRVDHRGGQKLDPQRVRYLLGMVVQVEVPRVEEELAGQRVAVGVQAGGTQPDDPVLGHHPRTVDDLVLLDHADAEARQVVVVLLHHAGVLGYLAAGERAAGLYAAVRHTPHYLGDPRRHDLPRGDVVLEEERLGSAGDDVVGAHGDQVDPHGIVFIEHLGELYLGAHAVGAAGEDWILEA